MVGVSHRVAVAALSGALSYASCFVPHAGGAQWGAGVIFGLLVLGPSYRGTSHFVVLAALSTAVYRVAVWSAQKLYVDTSWSGVASCALAGFAGAIALSLGSSVVLRTRATTLSTTCSAVVGAGAGALIGLSLGAPDESVIQHVLFFSGFVMWQVGYVAAHCLSPWPRVAGHFRGQRLVGRSRTEC